MNKETEITDNGLPKVLSQIITDNVYFLKQRHRVPQTSIANAMHITQSTLNLKLGGKVRWNADDLAYLSAFFNVSVAYLVTNNVTMPQTIISCVLSTQLIMQSHPKNLPEQLVRVTS